MSESEMPHVDAVVCAPELLGEEVIAVALQEQALVASVECPHCGYAGWMNFAFQDSLGNYISYDKSMKDIGLALLNEGIWFEAVCFNCENTYKVTPYVREQKYDEVLVGTVSDSLFTPDWLMDETEMEAYTPKRLCRKCSEQLQQGLSKVCPPKDVTPKSQTSLNQFGNMKGSCDVE